VLFAVVAHTRSRLLRWPVPTGRDIAAGKSAARALEERKRQSPVVAVGAPTTAQPCLVGFPRIFIYLIAEMMPARHCHFISRHRSGGTGVGSRTRDAALTMALVCGRRGAWSW